MTEIPGPTPEEQQDDGELNSVEDPGAFQIPFIRFMPGSPPSPAGPETIQTILDQDVDIELRYDAEEGVLGAEIQTSDESPDPEDPQPDQ